jgi:branched-chain amino acid transport system ATP-binding protein
METPLATTHPAHQHQPGALLQVRDIDVFYGDVQALRGVTIEVGSGELLTLVGANGAGKSTTLRTISGLLAPRRGEIRFDGERIDGKPAYDVVKRGIAHLPEGRDLFPGLSVLENLKLGYWVRRSDGGGFAQQVDRMMELFPRLRERAQQAAGTLSGGEQQMLGIARALMSEPRLLLVDELSLGLAPMVVSQLFDILRSVAEKGTAVLIVEQFVDMALAHSDRAYVLARGQVVLQGPSSRLATDPALVETYLGGGARENGRHRED